MQSLLSRSRGQLRPCLTSIVARPSRLPPRELPRSRWYATEQQLDLPALDQKWRKVWKSRDVWAASAARARLSKAEPGIQVMKDNPKDKMYILPMFPYPSGNLHLGHLRVYTIADVIARYRRLNGHNVLLPMGWDAFGLPAENAAIERGIDPSEWTRDNIARMKQQLELMNASFDWSREFATCDPAFYKQTQKIFLQLYKDGLVSQKEATVNWDPVDKTVLANEQVDADGRSWRSGALVELRNLKQWFFHITEFKEALLRDLEGLAEDEAWPERVLAMQKHWLGRTEGANYDFALHEPIDADSDESYCKVWTTRPDTIFAVQFIAISPNTPLAQHFAKSDPQLQEFLEAAKDLPPDSLEGYRVRTNHVVHPLTEVVSGESAFSEPIPIFVAPYVRADHGTGALMGVPAHDLRDWKFWKKHAPGEPLKYAVAPSVDSSLETLGSEPFLDKGFMTALAGPLAQAPSEEAAREVVNRLEEAGRATGKVVWKLRDWLISRQRYWGTPIPIVHCGDCGPQPVPEADLPVTLPRVDHHWASGKTGNPLESATEWTKTQCPHCGGPATRDTDTMDTFVDSSWYYMRFPEPNNDEEAISAKAAHEFLPVDLYVGGVEHAILHLLYARFIYKAMMGKTTRRVEEESGVSAQDRGGSPHREALVEALQEKAKKDSKGTQGVFNEAATATQESPAKPLDEPFKRLITQGMVHGKTYSDPSTGRFLKPDEVDLSNPSEPKIIATGEIANVTFEKMSKSKHNGVDPTTFITNYGADATRAHMLFQAPVDDVLNWDEDKIAGVTRWLRRVYDLVNSLPPRTGPVNDEYQRWDAQAYFSQGADKLGNEGPASFEADKMVWLRVQDAINSVTNAYEKVYPLNTAVSTLMTLTNTVLASPAASELVRFKATTRLLRMMYPITPAFAEECWGLLHPAQDAKPSELLVPGWPSPDGTEELLQPRAMPVAVQVNGKVRAVVEVPYRAPEDRQGGGFEQWLTAEILRADGWQKELAKGTFNLPEADKVFVAKGGAVINYVIKKKKA